MLHCYPYVPVGGEMALNCAILTYNGTAYFGFSGCVHAAPDLRRLETFLKLSFTELREAAGVNPPRKEGKKKEKKKVRAKDKAKVASTPAPTPEPVHVSIPLRPLASVESAVAVGPPVKEEEVLTRLIA
jgi:hypothetical protein